MSTRVDARTEYLEQLRDLLPYREGGRILGEVDLLIQDRMDAEMTAGRTAPDEAERRAVEALGPADKLARELMAPSVTIDLGTRRAFSRLVAITFAVHLLLAVVLTVAGTAGRVIPGLVHPLAAQSFGALFSSVLSIFLVDTGALFLLFALLGRGKAPTQLPRPRLRQAASRRDAVQALVLLVLVTLILHPFRDQIFAIRDGDRLAGIFAPPVVGVLPLVDVGLGLLAVRQIVILLTGGEHALEVLIDGGAAFVLAGAMALAATRSEIVRFPAGSLGKTASNSLAELVTRVMMLVFVAASLFLVAHAVKRAFRFRQLLAAP